MLEAGGYSVLECGDGADALAMFERERTHIQLVILDRSMPGWPVKVTLYKIRERRAAVPIIFFTGQDVTAQERAQVQGVLYKPLASERLLREVEHWLAK